jgi:ribosomal protein S18 acetylase RimI-like enzyme
MEPIKQCRCDRRERQPENIRSGNTGDGEIHGAAYCLLCNGIISCDFCPPESGNVAYVAISGHYTCWDHGIIALKDVLEMKDEVLIEPAVVVDAPAILELQKLACQSEAALYGDFAITPLLQSLDDLEADVWSQTVLKATLEGRIIGSVRGRMVDGTCHIGRLIVDPEFQNRGIGTRLLQAIERRFDEALRYELFTGKENRRHLYLYQKLGYRLTDREDKGSAHVTQVYLEKAN